jgi:ribonuclease HI
MDATASPKKGGKHHQYLNGLFRDVEKAPATVWIGTDGSKPLNRTRQATAAAVVGHGRQALTSPRQAVGRVSANEAELHAIRIGLQAIVNVPQCKSIFVFSDSTEAIRRSTDLA